MASHTILGEGAYYAPELTKVTTRRSERYIKQVINDPDRYTPNKRRMVDYNMTEEELNDIYAFLVWIGKIDLNGFPPEPNL